MKSALWTRFAAYACVAVLATSCGKKDKDKDDAPAKVSAPSIVGAESQGGMTRITFKSDGKDVSYKCSIAAEGTTSDTWVDCSADGWMVETQEGVRYTVRVKAIKNGKESAVDELTFVGGAGGDSGQQVDLVAVIQDKASIPATYSKTSLRVDLGVDGAAVDIEDIRFECKREYDADFKRCPDSDSQSYDFGQLIDGSAYSLAVRAVHTPSQAVSAEDSISFTVALARLRINGSENPELPKTGTVNIQFDQVQIQGLALSCSLNGGTPADCSTGTSLNLSQMQPGSYTLRIEAKDASQQVVASNTINFCARECSTQGGGQQEPMIQRFQIGSFYEYVVEPGMHVTEYATTKTYNNQLAFYRIMAGNGPGLDPYYLGNYGCYRDWDAKISAASPAGDMFDYCLTTPPNRDMYKWLTDYRLANNHLEIATDPELVVHNPNLTPGMGLPNHERITINVFDKDYEYMQDRSRFEQLCQNRRGTITKTPPIRFLDRGFWDNLNVKAEFYMCTEHLVGPGFGGLPSGGDKWWIGAFFITSDGLNLPRYECFTHKYYGDYTADWCGKFKNPSLLEVTFMTKTPYMDPADFARNAQMKFLRNLQELTPVLH